MTSHKGHRIGIRCPNGSQETDQRSLSVLQIAVWGVVIIVLVYAVYRVIALRWVCDDAFISFRYAQNLVAGHGLVFNAGERVEGYTNFLWTVIIALGMLLKQDPVPTSVFLGALSYFVTILTFGFLSSRPESADRKHPLFVPMTALCLLVCHDYHVFATSGLETSWVAMLVSVGFACLVLGQSRGSMFLAGLSLTAAAMSRPDALLFLILGILYVWAIGGSRLRNLPAFAGPLILIYIPYWIIRYQYYGYPFPNTYYAKSAGLPHYFQGLEYLWLFVRSYYVLFLIPVALAAVVAIRGRRLISLPLIEPFHRALVLSLLFVLPYTLYVVRSGGDFMFARFWIPILPLLFFVLEVSLRTIFSRSRLLSVILLVIPLLVLLRWNPYTGSRIIDGIAYEPYYYPQSWVDRARTVGAKMKTYFEGTGTKVSFHGMFAVYAFYSEVPTAIESTTGLTDEYIAHLPIGTRGRPGHEKQAPIEYLEQRGVNFVFRGQVPLRSFADSVRFVRFGDFDSYMITYDAELMNHLKQFKEIQFVDFPSFLDAYIPHLAEISDASLPIVYQAFKSYYFDHNSDPDREKPFLDKLRQGP